MKSSTAWRVMQVIAWTLTITAFIVVLSGCKSERTSDTPRPANAPCERCADRPTLTPTGGTR